MRACAAQYGRPLTALAPQKPKSRLPGSLIGQRHVPSPSSAHEQRGPGSTGAASTTGSGSARRADRMSCWVTRRRDTFRRSRFGVAIVKRERWRRLILPMTALRLTPISTAIWPHDSPAAKQLFSCSMRSAVHVLPITLMVMAFRLASDLLSVPHPAQYGSVD